MQLRDEDFGGFGVDDVAAAASAWTQEMHDVTFHNCIEGGWEPTASSVVEEIARVREAMAQVDGGLRECRRQLVELERPAWMRAVRRRMGR